MSVRALRLAGVAAAALGCTTVAYDGTRLPRNQVARLTFEDVQLKAVDDELPTEHYIEVLPGEHTIRLVLDSHYSTFAKYYEVTSRDVTICFTAQAGHFYSVQVAKEKAFASGLWRPVIVDVRTNAFMEHVCTPRARHPTAVPAAPPPADTAPPTGPPVPQQVDRE